MPLFRTQVRLSGWTGGPGINTFHFEHLGGATIPEQWPELLEDLYTAVRGFLVPGMVCTLIPEIVEIDPPTGQMTDVRTVDPWTVTGESGGLTTLSRSTMIKAQYRTDLITDGRRIRGGVYFGPIDGQGLDTDGSVPAGVQTAVINGHGGMIDAGFGRLMVYRRPVRDEGGNLVRPGVAGHVQAVTVKAVPAVLRSRRD